MGPIADLEKHLPSEWWRSLFNSIYLKTDSDVVENDENTMAEVDQIIALTGVEPYDNILDMCCGQGRHSLELARRGFLAVQGIDRSRFLIRLARARARAAHYTHLRFSEGDARKTRLAPQSMDCVVLMGNSFGYFEKEEDDRKVLEEVGRLLRSQGSLMLDITDGNWMKEHFEPRSWEWIDQQLLVCRERTIASDSRRLVSREVIIHADKGVITDQFYAERLYSYEELAQALDRAGFVDIVRHEDFKANSTRNQDLGMMGNRLLLTARAKEKSVSQKKSVKIDCTVILGDPRLPDKVKAGGRFNKEDIDTVNKLKGALGRLEDFQFTYVDNHSQLIKYLTTTPPPLVFNLCDEGYMNDAFKELHVPAILEMLKIPYTGASPACLGLCYDKTLVRALAKDLEIPVPDEIYIDPENVSAAIPSTFPSLVKPAFGDSSMGITQHAKVDNTEQLMSYFDWIKYEMPGIPILVQEFLPGREFSVAVLGHKGSLEALPILEVDYSRLPKDLPPILSYESKWLPDSPYWSNISYRQTTLDEDRQRQLVDHSCTLFERLDCRDYSRFDFREASDGTIKLLEANPNPGWCWDGKMNIMAKFAGLEYHQFLEKVLNSAFERYKDVIKT